MLAMMQNYSHKRERTGERSQEFAFWGPCRESLGRAHAEATKNRIFSSI